MWSVDHVQSYCINLDRRPDRWTEVKAQPIAKKIPNLQRFPGVEGRSIDLDTDTRVSTVCRYNIKNKTRRGHEMIESIGAVGCALSHIALWEKLVKSDQQVFLIIEDDIVASAEEWEKVRYLFAKYPQLADSTTWDIWSIGMLECFEILDKRPIDQYKIEDVWKTCAQFVGLQAYFITRRGAAALLKDVFPIQLHIDWYITYYAQVKPLKIIHNKLVNLKQNKAGSDINLGTCVICDIPTKVEETHYIIPIEATNAAVLAALSVAFVVWLFRSKRSR